MIDSHFKNKKFILKKKHPKKLTKISQLVKITINILLHLPILLLLYMYMYMYRYNYIILHKWDHITCIS